MVKIDIKPLSVNGAWQGKRFKTPEYKRYIDAILLLLPTMDIPKGQLQLAIEFGFSSKASDIDNCLKPFIDCLVKRYGFDDREIYFLLVKKTIVPKGKEFINFKLEAI